MVIDDWICMVLLRAFALINSQIFCLTLQSSHGVPGSPQMHA
jgi:hypothetical protein